MVGSQQFFQGRDFQMYVEVNDEALASIKVKIDNPYYPSPRVATTVNDVTVSGEQRGKVDVLVVTAQFGSSFKAVDKAFREAIFSDKHGLNLREKVEIIDKYEVYLRTFGLLEPKQQSKASEYTPSGGPNLAH